MNPKVDKFLLDGCMRCSLGGTPECKVHQWIPELEALRQIMLSSELTEDLKWGVPCYTLNNKNILMIYAFKDQCSVSFMKGALINDPKNLLEKAGENTQSARVLRFKSLNDVTSIEEDIKSFITQAIEIEKAGKKVVVEKKPEPIPIELIEKFESDEIFKSAFKALTPGRQRGYILHFSQAKQSGTRKSRIEKCTANILNGIGLHDQYKSKKK
jgi:uncharacterized protein YdeI (YjbR/CyaY-like superfamily)